MFKFNDHKAITLTFDKVIDKIFNCDIDKNPPTLYFQIILAFI
jgi:hypothetical protein